MSEENSIQPTGRGGGMPSGEELIAEPRGTSGETRRDIALLRRAARERWAIPKETQAVAVKRLTEIAQKTTVGVATAEGVVDAEGPADANAIAAIRTLAVLNDQDQKDDHLEDKNARLDDGKATERVAMSPVILRKPLQAGDD